MVIVWLPALPETGARFKVVSLPTARLNGNVVGAAGPASIWTVMVTEVSVAVPLFLTIACKGVLSTKKRFRSRVPRGERLTRNASVTVDGGVAPFVVNNPGRYRLIPVSYTHLRAHETPEH